jgi:8-oxo-dGTP pyrophosphatase MutT (NUDIX family)
VSRAVPLCPHCAQPAEEPLACDRCGWRWYANPKPAAAVLLERPSAGGEPSVLLLLRAMNPGRGAWDLPAGYLDPGESFEQAARREAREEAGLEVELLALAGVYHSPAANAVTVVYRARPVEADAEVKVDSESSSHAWVARSDLADWLPRIAFSSMAAALADWSVGRIGGPASAEPHPAGG